MATLDLTAIVRDVIDAFNAKDLDKLASCAYPDAKTLNVPYDVKLGFREDAEMWIRAFPDATCELTSLIGQGDCVIAEFTGRGTHTGLLKGPTGDLAPTGRKVEVPCVQVFKLRSGKITESRTYFDVATLLSQLGLRAPVTAQGREAAAPPPVH